MTLPVSIQSPYFVTVQATQAKLGIQSGESNRTDSVAYEEEIEALPQDRRNDIKV